MLKITDLKKKKLILITLLILILSGIITLVTILNMDSDKNPNKAVYVLDATERLENFNCI
jgi:hypothetical protein